MSGEQGRVLYFAYGANIHPGWLQRRIPDARLVGAASLPGYRLAFRKRGRDGAARSDACPDGAPGAVLPGALYELRRQDLARLGAAGAGYRQHEVVVSTSIGPREALTWRAEPEVIETGLRPWRWYVDLIRAGAVMLGLPEDYRRWLDTVTTDEDPDRERSTTAREVIEAGLESRR